MHKYLPCFPVSSFFKKVNTKLNHKNFLFYESKISSVSSGTVETWKIVLTGRAGKTWCCHTPTRVLLSDRRMSCWKVDLNCGKGSNAKTWMFCTQEWMKVCPSKAIHLAVHDQHRNQGQQFCSIDSSAKRDKKCKVWATGICPCVRFHWGVCHMSPLK